MRILLLSPALLVILAYGSAIHTSIPEYGYQVVHTYPHDRTAFTEGLFYQRISVRGHWTSRKVLNQKGAA